MKAHHVSTLLVVLVLAMFVFVSARPEKNETFDKITVKEFELVGDKGERRASIKVESGGEIVLRLMDKTGTIRVKLGASEDGSGLVLMDDKTEPAVHVLAKKGGGKLTVQDGRGGKRDF